MTHRLRLCLLLLGTGLLAACDGLASGPLPATHVTVLPDDTVRTGTRLTLRIDGPGSDSVWTHSTTWRFPDGRTTTGRAVSWTPSLPPGRYTGSALVPVGWSGRREGVAFVLVVVP